MDKLISCYTIIGRNVDLLKQWIECVQDRCGLEPDQYELDLVLWKPDQDVLDYAKEHCHQYVIYDPMKQHGNENYVRDLYACWNLGYEMSRCKYVFRSGSDQIFSKNFLKNAMNLIGEYEQPQGLDGVSNTAFYHLYTLESWEGSKAAYQRPCSRHIMPQGWWDDLLHPNWTKFDMFCESMSVDKLLTNEEYALPFKHPTRGWIFHTVGASWIQRKSTYDKYGAMIDYVGQGGITGDVELFDRGEKYGVPSLLLGNSFTFHRCKGES